MASVWKDILYPRKVCVGGKWFRFDRSDLENAVSVNKAKLADGWNIPVCYEHQDDAEPVRLSRNQMLADKAKSTCGWAEDFRIEGNRVEALIEVPNVADAQKLNAIRFVSPQVEWNFRDSEGKTWPGLTIQHIAATARPVQHRQDAIKLSVPANEVKHCSAAKGPLRLGSMGMDLKKVFAALAAKGIILPDDTTPENLIDRLYVACLQGDPAGGMAVPEIDDEPEPVPEDALEPEAAAKSEDAELKPDEKPIAMSLAKQRAEAELWARKNIARQVAALKESGVNPGLVKALGKKAESVKLSFNRQGDLLPNEVTLTIKAYREIAGSPPSPGGKRNQVDLSLTEAEKPAHMRADRGKTLEDMSDDDKAAMDKELDRAFGKSRG